MANAEHLEVLKKGVAAWNVWRHDKGIEFPDLRHAELTGAELVGANLKDANLIGADLVGAKLIGVSLFGAKLIGANLTSANLRDADLPLADLNRVNLLGAELVGVNLVGADLTAANMHGSNLSNTMLGDAILNDTNMSGCNVTGSILWGTMFARTDLSEVIGLDKVIHRGPSTIGLDTFFMSKGKIPEVFLRGAGVADIFIEYASSLAGRPFEFYSCFISYSIEDEEFASRLHNDFQAGGIRCWKWDHDARTGRSLLGEIDKAIRVSDKLVLIASESSLKSPAVNREIERALVQEDERLKRKLAGEPKLDSDVLFPVRLDDYIFKSWAHERKVDVTKKVVGDARRWDTDPAVYARVRDRLIRDLKNEKPKPKVKK